MQLLYLLLVVVIVVILFVVFRRPMYEVITLTTLILVVVTGRLSSLGTYVYSAAKYYIPYTIIAFTAFSTILNDTGVVTDFVDLIIALVGRFSGGAGYVALAGSSLFGALSGTGPGNTAAIGTICIPVMKKTGYSSELAATVEMAASALGPVIPPSGTVATAFALLAALYPDHATFSQFWLCMWGVALWFIFQRFLLLVFLVKKNKIGPIPKEERPTLHDAFAKGWKSALLPIVILVPFIFDAVFNSTLIKGRIGETGASALSTAMLAIVPSIAVIYTLAISKKKVTFRGFMDMLESCVTSVSPITMMVISGLVLGNLFGDLDIGSAAIALADALNLQKWQFIVFVPLFFCFLGMFLETQSLLLMLGSATISLGAFLGINPMLVACLLPCMSQAMGHMTPPFALTFYVAVGIAEADFLKSAKLAVLWCAGHYLFIVLGLMGILPILGLV